MIDKQYFKANMAIYFGDLLLSLTVLIVSFIHCLDASGLPFIALYLVCIVSLYRAGAFVHEICHRHRNEQMRIFSTFWNLTVGAIVLVPAARFFKPHLTHHSIGVFGTKDDPQYLLLRSDRKLAFFVLVVIPFIMPLFSLMLMVSAAVAGLTAEEAVERFVQRRSHTVGSVPQDEDKDQIIRLSRYYLPLFLLYVWLFPETLPLMYMVQVGAWWLVTLRIPLEHSMVHYVEKSDRHDHVLDSFTVEAPLAALLQPLGLRFHTAHHMYPGVPYHKLAALHAELKARDNEYRNNVISFWTAVRGPVRTPPTDITTAG